jgi:protein-S-isoprenylcysteine O-methyltransferase Ste14
MISGISLSLLLGIIIVFFFFMDFFFMIRYDNERKTGKGWAWDYTLLVGGLGLVIVLQPVLFPVIGFFTPKLWGLMVQVFGFALAFLSFVIHIWARLHLQKFYAERVEIQSDHKLINTGPYKWVRHPLVTSFFLLGTGVFFLSPALTTLVAMFYVYWDFSRAAQAEDELLGKNLPGYLDYMERVPRFLPRWKK